MNGKAVLEHDKSGIKGSELHGGEYAVIVSGPKGSYIGVIVRKLYYGGDMFIVPVSGSLTFCWGASAFQDYRVQRLNAGAKFTITLE